MSGWLAYVRTNARFLCAGVLLTFLSSFGQTFFISVFAGAIRSDFGLNHGQWGGVYLVGTMAAALVMIWGGGLADRIRVQLLGALVLVLLAGACLFMAVNTVVWLLPLGIFALRFAGQGMTSHLAEVATARWFLGTRGRALAIAGLGFALGHAVLPIAVVEGLQRFEWRMLWGAAALVVVAGLPVLFWLLSQERVPQSTLETPQSLGMRGQHWTRHACLHHWLFWMMVPALLGPAAFNTVYFFHQVHFSAIKGWSHLGLVAQFPLYMGVSILAMLGFGWAQDRWGTARILPFYQLPMGVAFLCFAWAEDLAWNLVGMVAMAITHGGNATLLPAFWAEFYGTRFLGAIKAFAAAVVVLGSALGPGISGVLIDSGIGLETQYLGAVVYFLGASALVLVGVRLARPLLPVAGGAR